MITGVEIQRLDEAYKVMADTAMHLREKLPSVEAEDINHKIEVEEDEVFEVKKKMIRKMSRGRAHQSSKITLNTEKAELEETQNEESKLKNEMERFKMKLDNQKDLIDDLITTGNIELIDRELQTLDKVYDDFVIIAIQVRNISGEEDKEKISRVISSENNNVFRKKKIAEMVTKIEKNTVRDNVNKSDIKTTDDVAGKEKN